MTQNSRERFRQIIEAARTRDGHTGIDTMIVNSHLTQMRMFMLRQGLEFYPRQDTFGFRKSFVNSVIEENEIDARLEGVVDDFLIDGKGLFYFRPVRDTYRIMWFSRDNYRAYYDQVGGLEEVELIYSFQVRQPGLGFASMDSGSQGATKYVKLKVRKGEIKESITDDKPSFEVGVGLLSGAMNTRTTKNSLGFIPAVECFNNMKSTGTEATGDFDWLAEHIIVHDDLVKNIRANITFYGNPTLVSSRPKQDLVESGDSGGMRPTISSQAGFYAANRPSTRTSQPLPGGVGGQRIPRIIANIEASDRVAYITPDAVSGDQNLYARQYREEIRNALGGVDELGASTGATAYEIKSLFGRAATTANRKCRGLLTYGLCKLLALMVFHEERVFRESFAAAIGMPEPPAPIREEMSDEKVFLDTLKKYTTAMSQYEQALEEKIREAVQSENLPPNVVGLIPDGDRTIEWRWTGPVFAESTEDILNSSIVVRNLQELGVNSIEALRYLFPDKTDEERSAMLSGYPFRMAQATQQSIGTFLTLISNMRQTPHPQSPDLPLLADPRLDLTPFVYRALEFLKRELTYSGQYSDTTDAGDPGALTGLERARVERGLPPDSGTASARFIPDPGGTFGSSGLPTTAGPSTGQSLAGGIQPPQRKFEREQELPIPGALLSDDPTAGVYAGTGGLSLSGGNPGISGSSFLFGAPDLGVSSNAGIFPGGVLNGSSPDERATPAGRPGKRRVPGRRQQRKP